MFVGDKIENINFKNMACQCDDAIPGSFARAVGNLGTSLHEWNRKRGKPQHSHTTLPD
jgi:hypothetical protein